MMLPLPEIIHHIEAKQYRAAADLLMQAGAVTEHQTDAAMVAAMIGTCHVPLCRSANAPVGTIRDLVIGRMIDLCWLKREAFK